MSTEFDRLLEDLERLEGCQRTKARVRRLLHGYVGVTIYISRASLLTGERKAAVKAMLAKPEVTRAEIVRALADRWGITSRMARIWLRRAQP